MKKALVGLGLLSFAAVAQADVLLVLSSSQGLFSSDEKIDHGMEKVGAEFVKSSIGQRYREVFTHTDLSKISVGVEWSAKTASS